MKKFKPEEIVERMKEGIKQVPKAPKTLFNPVIKQDTIRVRDMRQEAMDMGSHGSDAFKEGQSNAGAV